MKTSRTPLASSPSPCPSSRDGLRNKKAATAAKETPQAAAVRARPPPDFERRLTVQGTLEAKNFANVASRADGNLDAIWVDEGDVVVAGESALFQIDPVARENALTIARQNLEVAKSSLDVAKASAGKTKAEARKATLDFERYERLYKERRVRTVRSRQSPAPVEAGDRVADAQVISPNDSRRPRLPRHRRKELADPRLPCRFPASSAPAPPNLANRCPSATSSPHRRLLPSKPPPSPCAIPSEVARPDRLPPGSGA